MVILIIFISGVMLFSFGVSIFYRLQKYNFKLCKNCRARLLSANIVSVNLLKETRRWVNVEVKFSCVACMSCCERTIWLKKKDIGGTFDVKYAVIKYLETE